MDLTLTDEAKAELIASICRFSDEKLDRELGRLEAASLLEYFLKEIAPLAYNKGVRDAQERIASAVEDLPGTCFEEPLQYWAQTGTGRTVRRKPDR